MKLPGPRSYPKTVTIGKDTWTVKFCRKLDHNHIGECCPETYEIRIKAGLKPRETFYTFIHEVLHAIEFSHDLDIDRTKEHPRIYALEQAIGDLLLSNF